MSLPIEDYALLGDTQTAALVGRNGSIDWLCFPRFDSGAVFAALLGTEQHGHWQISPAATVLATRRRYLGDTLILETEFETDKGTVRLIDFMLAAGSVPRRRPHRRGRVRTGADQDGAETAIRVRPGRALGTQAQRSPGRRGRT